MCERHLPAFPCEIWIIHRVNGKVHIITIGIRKMIILLFIIPFPFSLSLFAVSIHSQEKAILVFKIFNVILHSFHSTIYPAISSIYLLIFFFTLYTRLHLSISILKSSNIYISPIHWRIIVFKTNKRLNKKKKSKRKERNKKEEEKKRAKASFLYKFSSFYFLYFLLSISKETLTVDRLINSRNTFNVKTHVQVSKNIFVYVRECLILYLLHKKVYFLIHL